MALIRQQLKSLENEYMNIDSWNHTNPKGLLSSGITWSYG
jgi:hypothetical protein